MPRKSKPTTDAARPFWRRYGRALIVFATVGGFAGVVWYSYSVGVRAGGAQALPLVRADLRPIKVAPRNPGGIDVPHKEIMVYDRLDGGAANGRIRKERITPPEEPMTVAAVEPAATKSPAPAPAAQSPAKAGLNAAPALPRGIAKPPPASNGKAPVVTAQYMGPFRIQLAAYRSSEVAARQWRGFRAKHKDLLGTLNPVIQRADLGKKGLYFRLQAGPLESRKAAEALCARLKQRKVSCLVVQL